VLPFPVTSAGVSIRPPYICQSYKSSLTFEHSTQHLPYCLSEVKALAYTSLIRPHLEYASAEWDPEVETPMSRRIRRFVCQLGLLHCVLLLL